MDDSDRRQFLVYVKEGVAMHGAALLAYCLMGNHYHLLIAVRDTPLSDTMHLILTRYAQYFNNKYGRVGHLFQGRFHAEFCSTERVIARVVAYIHRNPVRAGMVAGPGEWAWSSHGEILSGSGPLVDFGRLMELTGLTPVDLKELYLVALADAEKADEIECARIEERIQVAAAEHGVSVDSLRKGRRGEAIARVREELARWAVGAGVSDGALARALQCSRSAVTHARLRSRHREGLAPSSLLSPRGTGPLVTP